jgi:very-short-patch-repair endonuclease
LTELGFVFQPEFKFHDKRKWRLDYVIGCSPRYYAASLAVEIEGGLWTHGRHTRAKGYENDLRKYNAATAMGYRIFRFSTNQVLRGEARDFLKEHLK